ncbi:MAG: HDIG domain-containing protein [Gracilibacteraceae bacterium]|jgi:putative nucleotidyltransferase with HDIG domain|nr:HDIG domain-containing protein [Gracilibacteraceae bacterium]
MKEQTGQYKRHFWQTPNLARKTLLIIAFAAAITLLLSSGLIVSGQNISIGEPSPELIRAPYDHEVTDMVTYEREVEAVRAAVLPVYRVNEAFVNMFAQRFRTMFDVLITLAETRPALVRDNPPPVDAGQEEAVVLPPAEAAAEDAGPKAEAAVEDTEPTAEAGTPEPPSAAERQSEVEALRESNYYGVLADESFAAIMAMTPAELRAGRDEALSAMRQVMESEEEGARTEEDLPQLQERVMTRVMGADLPAPLIELTGSYVGQELLSPTLVIDLQATEWAREQAVASVTPEVYYYRANEKIVGPGEIVNDRIFAALSAYGLIRTESILWPVLGIALLVLLAVALTITLARQICPPIKEHWQKMLIIGVLELVFLVVAFGLFNISLGGDAWDSLLIFLVPAAWTTMTVSILLGSRMAVVVCVIQALFVAVLAEPQDFMNAGGADDLVVLFSGLVGAQSAARLNRRSDFARAALFVGLTNTLFLCALELLSGGDWLHLTAGLAVVALGAALTIVLTIGALPGFEFFFNITSSVRLIELGNPNNPLLKSLLMEAPGTYHHSVMVGNLAETAAEVIGADSVLVRIGALYHDIGKLKRPYFFIENQFSRENPHDRIAPSLSALILTSHTKDGVEMAKQYKLPESICAIIQQHHGDSLAKYFYHKAREETPDISEDIFRYSGPNPQTREAAIVMLADSVEAAVRAVGGSNPGKIEGLVRKIIKEKLEEGHLEQCDLTFRDLDKIAVSFVKVLLGIYHTRIVYPNAPPARKALKKPQEPPEPQAAGESDGN